jgi:hypothetical protein
MKTRVPHSSFMLAVISVLVLFGIGQFVLAVIQKQARVTEVVRDVRVFAPQAGTRAAVVNETVREGSAVRTGTESRSELTFVDQTITRLGANTVFSFAAGARAYDVGSGAVLIYAPKEVGTVRVSAGVATCAVSGFTGIWETHSKYWNKILILEGDGDVWLKKNPNDHRQMHSRQILVFPPNANVLPQPQEIDVCKVINNGLLVTGFSHRLPSWPLLVAECDRQKTAPGTSQLIDPTSQDTRDQSIFARPTPLPSAMPRPTIPPGSRVRP